MLPNFLIVGAMKGGSSALTRGISNHPDVFLASGKELHFFDRHFHRGASWYEQNFAEAGSAQAVGESTPHYMNDPEVRRRMIDTLPGAHFIAIIRHPVDRAYSHYWHNRRRGREERSFEEAIADSSHSSQLFAYFDLSLYTERLQSLDSEAGDGRLLVLINEDLRFQRPQSLRRVWGFIGVDPARGDVEEPKPPRSPLALIRRRRRANADYPQMADATRAELLGRFAPEVDRLEAWLGRDLSGWRA